MSAAGEPPRVRRFVSVDAAGTERLGAAFARAFVPETGRALRVALRGELGAGKTTFVRGLLRELGVTGAIRSPTYSLVERHATAHAEVLHADLYRLESAEELAALAFDDADRDAALWLVEWPERAGGALPPPDLQVDFQVEAGQHRLGVSGASVPGNAWLSRVQPESVLEVTTSAP